LAQTTIKEKKGPRLIPSSGGTQKRGNSEWGDAGRGGYPFNTIQADSEEKERLSTIFRATGVAKLELGNRGGKKKRFILLIGPRSTGVWAGSQVLKRDHAKVVIKQKGAGWVCCKPICSR